MNTKLIDSDVLKPLIKGMSGERNLQKSQLNDILNLLKSQVILASELDEDTQLGFVGGLRISFFVMF